MRRIFASAVNIAEITPMKTFSRHCRRFRYAVMPPPPLDIFAAEMPAYADRDTPMSRRRGHYAIDCLRSLRKATAEFVIATLAAAETLCRPPLPPPPPRCRRYGWLPEYASPHRHLRDS